MRISLSDVCLCEDFVRGRASLCGPAEKQTYREAIELRSLCVVMSNRSLF